MKKLKTFILGLGVIILTFGIFILLPAQLPELKDVNPETLIWACTYRGNAPERYFTWTWPTNEQPRIQEWVDMLVESKLYEVKKCVEIKSANYTGEEDTGILQYIHRISADLGMGKLQFDIDTDNENRVIVSGYLQYGILPEYEDEALASLISESVMGLEDPDYNLLVFRLLEKYSFPEKKGVVRNTRLNVTLINYNKTDPSARRYTISTDGNGYFRIVLEPDADASWYEVSVANSDYVDIPETNTQPIRTYFRNTTSYSTHLSCTDSGFAESPEKPNRAWIWAIIITVSAVFLLWWYIKHKSKRKLPEAVEEVEEIEEELSLAQQDTGSSDMLRIDIVFPDIDDDLPDVWGVMEPMNTLVRFRDREQTLIPEQPGAVIWGDGDGSDVHTGSDGSQVLSHEYDETGKYRISASYIDTIKKTETNWRDIRIVDYREEMVRLFNEMLGLLNITDTRIVPEMTAREVERILIEKLEGIEAGIIQRVVIGFEQANYSTHPVVRNDYVAMYRAVSEVIGKSMSNE